MAKKPTFFQERKDFISRMLSFEPKGQYAREQKFAKDLFNLYPVDFLIKVPKPSFDLNSLAYFLSKDGKSYLKKRYNEYTFKPEKKEIREGTKKEGEDRNFKRLKTLRQFLNE